MRKKRRAEIEQYLQAQHAAWETDKQILSLIEGGEGRISIGYATHSEEDYQELVPLVLDVMEELLKDCAVFTWLKTPPLREGIFRIFGLYPITLHHAVPNFAAQYAAEHPEVFFDGDAELLVETQGANRALMEQFYQSPDCATAYQHTVYGFYTPPMIPPGSKYEDAHFSVVHALPDYEIDYKNFHVELCVQINPRTAREAGVLETIKQVCAGRGKTLING